MIGRRRALAALAVAGMAPVLPAAPPPAPAWVPKPGQRADVSLNTLADVDPCPARECIYSGVVGQESVIIAWSGGAFADACGALGALVVTGGGHNDYYGNEVYAFDVAQRRWQRLNDPYPGGARTAVDYDECEYEPGTPLSSHTYQHLQYLPPALGGGTRGSLLLLVSYAAGPRALGSGRSHAFDLAAARWGRYSVNRSTLRVGNQSGTCFDAVRNVFWRVPYGGDTIHALDPATREWRSLRPGGANGNDFGLDLVCSHDPIGDRLVVVDWPRQQGALAWSLDLDRPHATWERIEAAGDAPPAAARGMSLEWCPPLRCFVAYEAKGAAYVRRLVPPSSPGSRWRWEREDLGGPPPASNAKMRGVYNRFRWAPSIGCFLMASGRSLPVQAWRLEGT